MRVTIATTKYTEGLQTLTSENLEELCNFTSVPIRDPDRNTLIGVASSPRIEEDRLTVAIELYEYNDIAPMLHFSIGYIVNKCIFNKFTLKLVEELELGSVILVSNNYHD